MTEQTGVPEGAEIITEAELEQYFQRVQSARNVMGGAALEAAGIVRDIKAHREPEYEPGGIYEDASGDAYFRLIPGLPEHGQWAWTRCSTGLRVGAGVPARPLRRLVPAPARDAIYATLANGAARENVDQLTDRICKLLEGGTDD